MGSTFGRNKREIESRMDRSEVKPELIDDFGIEIENESIKNDAIIDDSRLNEELLKQPLLFIKWVEISVKANQAAKAAKANLKAVEGETRLKYAQKGVRVADVDAKVDTDKDVKEARNALYEAEATAEKLNSFVRAIYQRGEALKDLCANKRKELID